MKAKTGRPALVVLALLALGATPALAQIESFDATPLEPGFAQFKEIDFEGLDIGCYYDNGLPCVGGDPNAVTSVRIGSVLFTDEYGLRTSFCSSPTCAPDDQNPAGGNVVMFLEPDAAITFASQPRVVVLDIQGMGDATFRLLVSDRDGRTLVVDAQGVLFGRLLLGLRSDAGLRRVQVIETSGGPLVLARLLYRQSAR